LLREDFSNVPTTAPFTNISLDTAIFDTGYSADGNEAQGTLYWNTDELTLSLVTNGETIELGQKVEVNVKNQTGSQINKGEVVYASGTVGNSGRILVTKMIADGTIAAKRILGVAAENIADGADGKVIQFGKLRKINTTAFSEGDILWVSTTVAGAFQNTEPVQANGEIALPIAFVVTDSVNNGEIFVRVTPIDENEYQNYDAGLQEIAGLTPTDSNIIVGDGTNWVAESGATARASLGLTIGTHVQAWDAQLDTLSGLSANQATAIVAVTDTEYQQLQNIDSVTISNTQWGYLGALDQALATGDSPTFGGLTVNGNITVTGTVDGRDISDDGDDLDELYTTIGLSALTAEEVNQLENIGETTTISATQWGYLGVLDQNLRTTDAVTFSTVDTGQGANELYAMNQDVQTTDDVTFNVIDVTDKIESASGYTSGITGAGTIYDMDDGNGSFFEVDNMRVRNELRAHIFKKDIVKASNAYLFITDAAEIAETSVIVDTTDTFRVLDGDDNATFSHGDLLWAKNIDDDASLQVTGVKIEVSVQPQFVWDTSEEVWNTSTITPDSYTEFASGTVSGGIHDGKTYTEYNIYEVTSGGTLNAGDTIVRISDGSILNDASSQYSPFIDIYDGVETWADFQDVSKTKVRLGNLEGVSNASGYGLYTQNAFLTGALLVGDLTKAGQYMEFDGSTLTVKGDVDITGTTLFKKSDSTLDTATVLNDITFIDGGSIVTDTITANQIAAGTITANEIDVADLFAEDATVAGTLTIGSGTTIKLGELATASFGLELNANNYWKLQTGVYNFRVGDTNSFISFNTSSNVLDITTNTFDLDATTVLLSSSGSGKIALGTDADNILPNDGVGFYADGSGNFLVGSIAQGSDSYISFDGSDLTIETATFTLETTNLSIDSSNEVITLGSGTTVTLGKIDATNFGLSLDANNFWKVSSGEYFFKVGSATNFISFDTSSETLDIETDTFTLATSNLTIDSTNELISVGSASPIKLGKLATASFGLEINANNYWKLQTGVYSFKVGDASNFISFNTSSNVLDITTDTFDLEASNLAIKSTGTTYPSASANTEVTTADVTNFRIATLGSGFDTNSLAISNNRWVKFQFDYSQSVPGSFTAGITVTLEVSTDNSTFTDYGLFSDTRIDFNTNYFVADNATGNRLNVVDLSDSTKTSFRFKSSQTDSCSGTITMYFYVNEKDTTTHIRFNVLDSAKDAADSLPAVLTGASATNIGTRDYNPVTELNPSGIFTRLSDSLILSNGNTYIDYSLIT
jgi:hypothetical protein